MQVGSIGLLGAIERFDPNRGDEFAAFAVPTIAGEMKRHLRDRAATVRLPRRLHQAATRLPEARAELTVRLRRSPVPAELAKELGVRPEEIAVLEQTGPSGKGMEPEAAEAGLDDRILLSDAFRALDETERPIVYLRYIRELSRRETAQQLGMTEDRLRGLTRGALAKLRGELEGRAFREAAAEPAEPPAPAATPRVAPPEPAPDPLPPPPPPPPPPLDEPKPKAHVGHSGRLLVRMPPSLHNELAEAAEREDISLNQYIATALADAVGEPDAASRKVPHWLPTAIVTNIAVLVVTAIVGLVLLVVALTHGL